METLHGVRVEDPFRWLEDGESPAVRAWSDRQNALTRARLDAIPWRSGLRERLATLFQVGSVSAPVPRGGRYFHLSRSGAEEQPILYVREGLEGPDRVLLDPAALEADAASALDWWYPSPDGRRVAYGLSQGGSEKSGLRVRDVEAGADLPDQVPWTRACSLEWRSDGSGFFYTRYPKPGTVAPGQENYDRRVFRHSLGEHWSRDAQVFPEAGTDREPEDWPSVSLSPDGRWLGVSVSRGWTRTDVYLRDLRGGTAFAPVALGRDALFGLVLRDDRIYLLTNLGAPRFRLLVADPRSPGPESWRELIAEADDVLETFAVVGDRILVQRLRDASSRLLLHDLEGRPLGEIPLAGRGTVTGLTGAWDGDEAFFGFSSYTTPPSVYRVDLASGATRLWRRTETRIDPDAYRVDLDRCLSRDGTAVSLFLVRRKDRPSDGTGPAVLTGYGGFGVSLTPSFGRSLLHFLDRGGLYAVAHLRGGGEYGEAWHRAGMREHKQNVFDDFLAAAHHLRDAGHTAPDRLAILGGSNGGLLVGAALTQRPDLFRAVVCQVPLLDMLRYHRFRIARLWIPEYGSPDDPEAFGWLLAYSPYHRVRQGTAYPAVLLTAGEEDSRVDPLHARKMAARLQAASSSGRPILLRTETRAGHGQGKPISKVLEEWTDVWAFLMAELGIPPGA